MRESLLAISPQQCLTRQEDAVSQRVSHPQSLSDVILLAFLLLPTLWMLSMLVPLCTAGLGTKYSDLNYCEPENKSDCHMIARCPMVALIPFTCISYTYLLTYSLSNSHCRLNEALAEIYRVLKPGGLYFASTFFVGDVKRLPTGGGFMLFESPEELNGMVSKAGFANSGGATVVRKEGRGCAIIKCMKSPIPDKDTPGMLSELFNDTFKVTSGGAGEDRLTLEQAASVSTGMDVTATATTATSTTVTDVVEIVESAVEEVVAVVEEAVAAVEVAVTAPTDPAPESE